MDLRKTPEKLEAGGERRCEVIDQIAKVRMTVQRLQFLKTGHKFWI